ncbi:hypothetical protein [Natrononativus amylolyticus]|uniref:hypothetical protein n=1 Tax=Natrononativus amylolyticus TaxID=2963434 RepID=UPI0020CD0AE9|nr:hypothetical protein [Natrononativus amylolyticus]
MTAPSRAETTVGVAAMVGLFVVFEALFGDGVSLDSVLAVSAGGALVVVIATSEMSALERRPAMLAAVALSILLVALALWLHA